MTKQTANNDDNKAKYIPNVQANLKRLGMTKHGTPRKRLSSDEILNKKAIKLIETKQLIQLSNDIVYRFLNNPKISLRNKVEIAKAFAVKAIPSTLEQVTGYKIILIEDTNGHYSITGNDYTRHALPEGSSREDKTRVYTPRDTTVSKR